MKDYRRERHSYVSRAGGDEGGQFLRWEDCIKRDVKKTGEEGSSYLDRGDLLQIRQVKR